MDSSAVLGSVLVLTVLTVHLWQWHGCFLPGPAGEGSCVALLLCSVDCSCPFSTLPRPAFVSVRLESSQGPWPMLPGSLAYLLFLFGSASPPNLFWGGRTLRAPKYIRACNCKGPRGRALR